MHNLIRLAQMAARAALCLLILTLPLAAQSGGSISGTVSLKETGLPIHGVSVVVVELGRAALTGDDGTYEFSRVPAGHYHVIAHLDRVFEGARILTVESGTDATADFTLSLTGDEYEITITASETHEDAFESFSSVDSYDASDLSLMQDVSIGEALGQNVGSGVTKRSFGPGASRPIVRGFDGDRVLVMEDGIRTGTLGSTSGDHGEVINAGLVERVEIVKGPATLLYSGNAVGGTINAVGTHHVYHRFPHPGKRGFVSGAGGTANGYGSANVGFEYGVKRWMLWGSAGTLRSGDYMTPEGPVYNSRSNMRNGMGGFGWFGDKTYFQLTAKVDESDFGVPFAAELHAHGHEEGEHKEGEHEGEEDDHEDEEHGEELDRIMLDARRVSGRLDWGLRSLGGPIESLAVKLSAARWQHDEIEHFEDGDQIVGTEFKNDQFVYRAVAEQTQRGVWGGRFGIWGIGRDYDAVGEEALSPPVKQNGFAVFALEEFDFERVKFQLGARLESQRYNPAYSEREAGGHDDDHEGEEGEEEEEEHHDGEIPDAINRAFTGFSAAAGMHADLWRGGAFVARATRSYRAPALEELYNFGPHAGTLSFDIGNPSLAAESGNGADFSLRHRQGRVEGEANFFVYDFSNFIFPYAPGEEEDGLQVIEYTQLDARYLGAEALLGVQAHRSLSLNFGLDMVDARSTATNTPLPRIPPLRTKVGFEYRARGFRVRPELIVAAAQNDTFTGETPTDGYAVVNLKASYTYARRHVAHQFTVNVFNVGDRLYRNHSSYIKDLAPEIGRGVRIGYTFRFF